VRASSSVSWVNFYADLNWIASSPPCTDLWNSASVSNGQHVISAKGFSSGGTLVGTSAINLNVQNGSVQPSPSPTVAPTAILTSTPTAYFSLLPAGSPLQSDTKLCVWGCR
jgi:hypothetical protein